MADYTATMSYGVPEVGDEYGIVILGETEWILKLTITGVAFKTGDAGDVWVVSGTPANDFTYGEAWNNSGSGGGGGLKVGYFYPLQSTRHVSGGLSGPGTVALSATVDINGTEYTKAEYSAGIAFSTPINVTVTPSLPSGNGTWTPESYTFSNCYKDCSADFVVTGEAPPAGSDPAPENGDDSIDPGQPALYWRVGDQTNDSVVEYLFSDDYQNFWMGIPATLAGGVATADISGLTLRAGHTYMWNTVVYNEFGDMESDWWAFSVVAVGGHIVTGYPPGKPINPYPTDTMTGLGLNVAALTWESGS